MTSSPQPAPVRAGPDATWPHYALWERVQTAFQELPLEFKSTLSVSGISATEIFRFGAVLGATIEEEVVRTLNALRPHWDPTDQYTDYVFIRQDESFPDVLLTDVTRRNQPILGVELKSWYVLAKEGEPSLRFKTTAAALAPQDLIVMVPWALSNVVSGTPIVFTPYVEISHYLADYRNYWWQHIRSAESDTTIHKPEGAVPYPPARSRYSDEPAFDSGGNFGRLARMGIIDSYIRQFDSTPIIGISIKQWRDFFKRAVR